MDHKATIDAVLAGDHARFTDLVTRFDAPVRRIVEREVRDDHGLDEVVQEIWFRAYRQLSQLGDVAKLEAWLGRIARNCVTDHFRERRRLARFVPLTDESAHVDAGPWIWDLVERLDPPFREVLTRRYREHLSYAEIAALVQAPVSTVRGRLFQARVALRRLLERKEALDHD